jgi:hypothetical protein
MTGSQTTVQGLFNIKKVSKVNSHLGHIWIWSEIKRIITQPFKFQKLLAI